MRASTASARDEKGFDRTGILTVRCRHAILLAAVVMTSGEKFAYSLAALAHLLAKGLPISRLWYDVGDGRLYSAMQAFQNLQGVVPLLPELHAKMHAVRCQLLWAGTMRAGAGLPNSELSEQENRRLGLVRSAHNSRSDRRCGKCSDHGSFRTGRGGHGDARLAAGSRNNGHGGRPAARYHRVERGPGKFSKGTGAAVRVRHIDIWRSPRPCTELTDLYHSAQGLRRAWVVSPPPRTGPATPGNLARVRKARVARAGHHPAAARRH